MTDNFKNLEKHVNEEKFSIIQYFLPLKFQV